LAVAAGLAVFLIWLVFGRGGTAPGPGPSEVPVITTGEGAPTSEEDSLLNPRIFIQGGDFLMGSPSHGAMYRFFFGDDRDDERPQHRVRLSSFFMQQHEVTNEEYQRFDPDHVFAAGHEKYPIVHVTRQDAMDYAEWLGGGLPTEAQWEFAARGTDGRTFPWGEARLSCARANFWECSKGAAQAVGSHPKGATPEGVEDLSGNVLEWCRDWYGTYSEEEQEDPTGPETGEYGVSRGGSTMLIEELLRGAARIPRLTEWERSSKYFGFSEDLGFRVVWSSAGGLD